MESVIASTDLVTRATHQVLRLCWHSRLRSRLFTRNPLTGAQMLVWYGRKLLLIGNSYRDGLFLPGGGIHCTESAARAAARELREETGILIGEQEMCDRGTVENFIEGVPVRDRIFATALRRYQPPHADEREVVRALFVPLEEALGVDNLGHLRVFMRPELVR